jgi:hypothetical protein
MTYLEGLFALVDIDSWPRLPVPAEEPRLDEFVQALVILSLQLFALGAVHCCLVLSD